MEQEVNTPNFYRKGERGVSHVWAEVIQIAASSQIIATLLPDLPRREPIEPILEFDLAHKPFRQAIITSPVEHENGIVHISDGPGLGITINLS